MELGNANGGPSEKTLYDLGNDCLVFSGMDKETQRKVLTGLRVLAPRLRPELAALGLTPDEILAQIPILGFLANYKMIDEALESVITVPMREALVQVGHPDEQKQRQRCNRYSYPIRKAIKKAIHEGWPFLNGPAPSAEEKGTRTASIVRILPVNLMNPKKKKGKERNDAADESELSAAKELKPGAVFISEEYRYLWYPRDWPDEVRLEFEEWRAYALAGEKHGQNSPLPDVRPLRQVSVLNVERAIATYFGGLRRIGLVSEETLSIETLYALANDQDAMVEWVNFLLERSRTVREMPDYVPRTIPHVLEHLATWTRTWYYPKRRPQLFAEWKGIVPDSEIKALPLVRKWRSLAQALKPADRPIPSSDEIWMDAMAIFAEAEARHKLRERAIAYRNGVILALLAYCPIRGRNLSEGKLGKNEHDGNFYVDDEGRWHVQFKGSRGEYKTKEDVYWELEPRLNEYLNAWVNNPDQRQYLLPVDPKTNKRIDLGFMFPSSVGGGQMNRKSITKFIRSYTWAASGGKLSFPPHDARHGAATSIAEAVVKRTGTIDALLGAARVAASLLGIKEATVKRYYDRLGQSIIRKKAGRIVDGIIAAACGPADNFRERVEAIGALMQLNDDDTELLLRQLHRDTPHYKFMGILKTFGADDRELAVFWRRLYPNAAPLPLITQEPRVPVSNVASMRRKAS